MRGGIIPLFMSLLVSAASAVAQTPHSSDEVHRTYDAESARLGAIELKQMGGCIYHRDQVRAVSLLRSRPGSDDEANIGNAMQSQLSKCIGIAIPWLHWSWVELRGSIAEAAYQEMFAADPDYDHLAHQSLALLSSWTEKGFKGREGPMVFSHDFANCVVSMKPNASARLIRTEPRSAAERKTLTEIIPALSGCLQRGNVASLDAASLRALVSEALYRSVLDWQQEPTATKSVATAAMDRH